MLTERTPTWTETWKRDGEATMLLRQLERRFGSLDSGLRQRVEEADSDRLLRWGDRILTAERVEDIFES